MQNKYTFRVRLEIAGITVKAWMKVAWCTLFHRRYHKRTGERNIRGPVIWYDVFCKKCGTKGADPIIPMW